MEKFKVKVVLKNREDVVDHNCEETHGSNDDAAYECASTNQIT